MSNLFAIDQYSNGVIIASLVGVSAITLLFMRYQRNGALNILTERNHHASDENRMIGNRVTTAGNTRRDNATAALANASGVFPATFDPNVERDLPQNRSRSWNQIFDDHREILPDGSILRKQCQAFSSAQVPTNSAPEIQKIPIHENEEELVDLRHLPSARIQMLPDPSTPFESPFLNSGLPNASKMRSGLFLKLEAMVEAVDELAPYFGYEPGQIQIKIFEGLRDLETQQSLFDKKLAEIQLANPEFTLERAELETSKWVTSAKKYVPVHSTGAAVDLSLWDCIKDEVLDMGIFGAIWGKNESAPTFSENITNKQKRNRLYCALAAEKAGLTNYPYEFWHFSFGDRCDAYWNEREVLYGPI